MSAIAIFKPRGGDYRQRLLDFVAWGRPGGLSGLNTHRAGYEDDDPWFSWDASLCRTANTQRSALVRSEYLGMDARALSRPWNPDDRPKILRPEQLIATRWFIRFAKAYLNVLTAFKGVRSYPKAAVVSLSAFEAALRQLGLSDDESFANVHQGVFARAADIVAGSRMLAGATYDAGKELEILSGMLQAGYHSKTLRLDGCGFRLVLRPFSFRSPFPQPKRQRARLLDPDRIAEAASARLSNETIAAVGQAYRRSVDEFGRQHRVTNAAGMVALPLVTTSMRVSDMLQLRADCLRHDPDADRWRIAIYRPKIHRYQDVPIPRRLGPLAEELVALLRANSQSARDAFDFYISKFGDNFQGIDELYVPPHVRSLFRGEHVALPRFTPRKVQGYLHMGDELLPSGFPIPMGMLRRITTRTGVNFPDDIFAPGSHVALYISIERLKSFFRSIRRSPPKMLASVAAEQQVSEDCVLEAMTADGYGEASKGVFLSIHCLFAFEGRAARSFAATADLKSILLAQFKSTSFAHWPYTSSDRKLKLNEALLVGYDLRGNPHARRDKRRGSWWMPRALDEQSISVWCQGRAPVPPLLFEILSIRLESGEYPTLTLQETRKYIQTQALLAGVHETFVDELAGRKSGRQSEHYDLRTPAEIAARSIELFDPSDPINVVGPVAQAALKVPIADREAFLYSSAAPKQLTEVGGCTTSWTMSPCHKHGSCMRCESAVWRKGDEKRLSKIHYLRDYSIKMIAKGDFLLKGGGTPEPIRRHIQQHQDVLDRCNSILAAEANDSIARGSLVTFEAPDGALGSPELIAKLRAEREEAGGST